MWTSGKDSTLEKLEFVIVAQSFFYTAHFNNQMFKETWEK